MSLLDKVGEIVSALGVYDQESENIENEWKEALAEEEEQNTGTLSGAKEEHDDLQWEASERKKRWEMNLYDAETMFREAQSCLAECAGRAAFGTNKKFRDIHECIDALKNNPGQVHRSIKPVDNQKMVELLSASLLYDNDIPMRLEAIRRAVQVQYEEETGYATDNYESTVAYERSRHQDAAEDINDNFIAEFESHEEEFAEALQSEIDFAGLRTEFDARTASIPVRADYEPVKEFPKEICFGNVECGINPRMSDMCRGLLIEKCGYLVSEQNGETSLRFPIGYGLDDTRFSALFEFENTSRDLMARHMRSMVLRIMMSVPINKAWFTMIDPIDLGRTFSVFAPWGEARESVIDTRIWMEEDRIEERLNNIVEHTADVNFRCLQGVYRNILEYNAAAGKNAEPLRFLMIMDFPRRFSPESLEKLESIVNNGPSTGVFALIAGDREELENSTDPAVQRILSKVNVFRMEDGISYAQETVEGQPLRFSPIICSEDDEGHALIGKIAGLLEQVGEEPVNWSDIYPENYRMMSSSALNGISIPLGMEGANRRIVMNLGGTSDGVQAKNYHAIVGGTIGSGKSTMLHSIITGALVSYKPTELQMYLVDMKGGVEFRRYAQHMDLGNIRVLGIDAEKEFGLSVLKDVAQEQKQRSSRFRESGVSRIEDYNRRMIQLNRTEDIMPRLLVVMDEVQYLFDSEEDPITRESIRLLEDLILMGGSAYGIQIILATQDWDNVKGLNAGLYNNIGVRIALRNTPQSAKIILADDNEIAARMATYTQGQAVFNEYAGHKDYNRPYRGILLREEECHELLNELSRLQKLDTAIKKPARQRLLSADVHDNRDNPLNVFCMTGNTDTDAGFGYRLWYGENLGMVNTYYPSLFERRANNLLFVGGREEEASTVMGMTMMSLLVESVRFGNTVVPPVITLFDFGSEELRTYNTDRMLVALLRNLIPEAIRVFDDTNVLDGLDILEQELDAARNGADTPRQFVLFFGLNRARRLITGNTYEGKPRDRLARLICEGPENGMNFVVWANDPEGNKRYYGDILDEFELRVMLNTENEDMYQEYTLEKKPETVSVGNGVSYSMSGDNVIVKLYGMPTGNWLNGFANRINGMSN